jgi:hypothetical protein
MANATQFMVYIYRIEPITVVLCGFGAAKMLPLAWWIT